ncbi:MAG: hypothetical protein KIS77_03790 [Saprospiraceae bacterium]|nr:hypothetical protein [Saprospiraceae bacterium]
MNEEEKKDISDPRINYRTDWAETHGERREPANEKSNQAKGEKIERVRDADGGKVKSVEQILQEGKKQEGKLFKERIGKAETLKPPKEVMTDKLVEQNKGVPSEPKKKTQALFHGDKDLHLKSTTALTDPETAKQNLKDASKAKNFGKETPPSRGGGFRGGGSPMMREPDEILKEKHKNTNPEDILSQKDKKPAVTLPQQKQESQPQQAKHKSSFMASLDAKIQEQVGKQDKAQPEKPVAEKPVPKREGIISKIEKKVDAVKKATAEQPKPKAPKTEIAKVAPKPIIKGR